MAPKRTNPLSVDPAWGCGRPAPAKVSCQSRGIARPEAPHVGWGDGGGGSRLRARDRLGPVRGGPGRGRLTPRVSSPASRAAMWAMALLSAASAVLRRGPGHTTNEAITEGATPERHRGGVWVAQTSLSDGVCRDKKETPFSTALQAQPVPASSRRRRSSSRLPCRYPLRCVPTH